MNRAVGVSQVYHVELAEVVDGLDGNCVCEGTFFWLKQLEEL